MIKRLLLVCALISVSGAQFSPAREVRHYIQNEANLIETAQGYALNDASLLAHNWKAVSVNGDNVQVYTPSCQVSSLSQQQVPVEQQQVIARAKQSLLAPTNNVAPNLVVRRGSYRISMDGSSMSSSSSGGGNMAMSSFTSNGISVMRLDAQTMSIGRPAGGLPNNLNRVFISNDLLTFVYQDGRVLMKPAACLAGDEQQLVQQLRLEAEEEKRKFDMRMQQFQANMQNMQSNLQRNMQNMQSNLQNMFQPGFPFSPAQPMRANQFQQPQRQQMQQMQGFGQMGQINQNGMGPMGSLLPFQGNQRQQQPAFGGGFPAFGGNTNAFNSGNMNEAAGGGGANWPFGQNNSPFYPGFPFGQQQ